MNELDTVNRNRVSKLSTRTGGVLMLAALMLALSMSFVAPSAMAQGDPIGPLRAVEPFAAILAIVGVVLIVVGYLGRDQWEPTTVMGALTVGVLILAVGLLPILVGPPEVDGDEDLFKFELIASVGTTAGSTVPAGNYDDCDTEAGGTTGEWTATEGTYDAGAKTFTGTVAQDSDLATTAALWSEPNCLQLVFSVRLLNGRDADGDGTTDAVNYFMRIVSISRTTLATDGSNGTLNTAGFVRDGVSETNDWYLLYLTDASTWIAACPEARTSSTVPSSCGWANVGNHNGGAADTINAYIILEDRGLFGYQEPATGSSVIMVYEFGGPEVEPQQFQLMIRMGTRATTNLS